jgi:hypothetical protein
MFIRFAERGTALFCDLCVIVRVVDVYVMLLQERKIYYWKIEVIMFIINIGGPGGQVVTVIVLRPTLQ